MIRTHQGEKKLIERQNKPLIFLEGFVSNRTLLSLSFTGISVIIYSLHFKVYPLLIIFMSIVYVLYIHISLFRSNHAINIELEDIFSIGNVEVDIR